MWRRATINPPATANTFRTQRAGTPAFAEIQVRQQAVKEQLDDLLAWMRRPEANPVTSISTTALEMKIKLLRLCDQHRIAPAPVIIPLTEPIAHDVIVEGYASTPAVDLERTRVRPFALAFLSSKMPPLLYRHDATQPAGTILELAYKSREGLFIRAKVTHAMAKRCQGFSVGARVLRYSMVGEHTKDFYAQVDLAELVEVDITDRPSNPQALVSHRHQPSAAARTYELLAEKTKCLTKMVTLLQEMHP